MKFTIEVVPVEASVVKVPVGNPVLSIPVFPILDHVPEQETIVYRQFVSGQVNEGSRWYWLWGDNAVVLFGDGQEILL